VVHSGEQGHAQTFGGAGVQSEEKNTKLKGHFSQDRYSGTLRPLSVHVPGREHIFTVRLDHYTLMIGVIESSHEHKI
jgi:hypothetical protein